MLEADHSIQRERKNSKADKQDFSTRRYRLADHHEGAKFSLEDEEDLVPKRRKYTSPEESRILHEHFHSNYWPHFPQNAIKGFGQSTLTMTITT
jgi:hypothetical protein